MTTQPAYSRKQVRRAVNLSAFLGWLAIALPISSGLSGRSFLGLLGVMIWAAVIGLPIAFGACRLIGGPILTPAMRSPLTWRGAAVRGGLIAFAIAFVCIAIGRLRGLKTYLDPTAFYQIGGDDTVREVDGILTAYGWSILSRRVAAFVLLGSAVALCVRAVIGPGRRP